MNDIWGRFCLSLLLTLLIEGVAARCLHIRKKDLLLVVLVNILTNPAAVLFSMLFGDKKAVQLLLETVVILVEGWYYKKYGKEIRHGYVLSMILNGISYGMGLGIGCWIRGFGV